jgi:hypothetical protein
MSPRRGFFHFQTSAINVSLLAELALRKLRNLLTNPLIQWQCSPALSPLVPYGESESALSRVLRSFQ